MIIDSTNLKIGNDFGNFSQEIIKNEPMFFNCSIDYAYANGGPITKSFIEVFLNEQYQNLHLIKKFVVDSRVHMLMKDWYPCIPGYHHDDVPRNTKTGQPNYYTPTYRSNHVMGLINGDICPTEFALGVEEFSDPDINRIIYGVWDKEVKDKISQNKLKRFYAPSSKVIYFDDRVWHTGTKALTCGWRWFIRISWNTERVNNVTNEIRKQVQVYLDNENKGW